MIVGAAIHDYEHPYNNFYTNRGTNNPYQINAKTELALTYNDKSPLENHHVSASFMIMRDEQYNIFGSLSKED